MLWLAEVHFPASNILLGGTTRPIATVLCTLCTLRRGQ